MKTKWMFFLIVLACLANLGMAAAPTHGAGAPRFQAEQTIQAATPQPEETNADATAVPRPPSEAGQNMVLIVGAATLVLIVFFGVALHHRLLPPNNPRAFPKP